MLEFIVAADNGTATTINTSLIGERSLNLRSVVRPGIANHRESLYADVTTWRVSSLMFSNCGYRVRPSSRFLHPFLLGDLVLSSHPPLPGRADRPVSYERRDATSRNVGQPEKRVINRRCGCRHFFSTAGSHYPSAIRYFRG